MLTIKSAQFGNRPDFQDTRVRRLIGRLAEVQNHAEQSLQRFEQWELDQQWDLSLEDAWRELDYQLGALGFQMQDVNY